MENDIRGGRAGGIEVNWASMGPGPGWGIHRARCTLSACQQPYRSEWLTFIYVGIFPLTFLGFNFNYLSYTFALCDFWLVSSKIFCGMKMERKKGKKDGRKRGESTRGLVPPLKNTYISVPISQFIPTPPVPPPL